MVGTLARIGGRLTGSRRAAPDPDDVSRVFEEAGSDATWRTRDTVAATLSDQPSRIAGQATGAVERTSSTAGRTVLGIGAIGGGTYVGSQYVDYRDRVEQARDLDDQRELIQEIRNDESLTAEQQENLIAAIAEDSNAFDSPWEQTGDGGSDGILPEFPSLFSTEGVVLLLAVVFIGRAIVRRSG